MPEEVQAALNQLHPLLAVDVLRLYWEFRTLRPEIVHAWLDWCNVRAGLAAALAGVPRIIVSGRNLSPRHFTLDADYFHPAYTALAAMSERRLALINNSQAGADDYAAWLGLPNHRIKVVRNGVQFSEGSRPSRQKALSIRALLKIAPSVPLIGGMFRFEEEKQPALWLRTAKHVATAIPEAQFVLYGQGGLRGEMEKIVRDLDMGSRVHFGGVVSPSTDALAPCDLLLLTSRGEGTPNVLLEAQWLGIPVVTTNAGGAGEAVVDGVTGKVVRSNDEASISAAVVEVLADETFRRRAGTEGPAFVSSTYGMDRMIRDTLDLYDLGKPSCSDGELS
ncbi:glycosyltransferase [Hyphomicrobium sp. 1Nfss2.1]|uniref:glycosyltransferase n=1 Tax=Hyphomicrobium sp. 1Nfss2.1 TaxID=3413936 RepID=UPI003C7B9DBB